VVLDTLTHSARLRARSISVAYLSRGIHVSPFLYTDVHTYIFIGRKVRILENNLLSHTLIVQEETTTTTTTTTTTKSSACWCICIKKKEKKKEKKKKRTSSE
jgi:hypothetical protein